MIYALGATAPGAWLFARVLRPVDAFVYRLSNERSTLTSALAGLPIIVVDTIGAKSGLLRRIPLVGLADPALPGAICVIGSNFGQKHHPAWLFNLRALPDVEARISDQRNRYHARELVGADYDRIWAIAVALYPGYARYKISAGARRIAILRLEPVTSSPSC
jgi:deazaflavin-dependent oxidoreductase (nitroreductase family)